MVVKIIKIIHPECLHYFLTILHDPFFPSLLHSTYLFCMPANLEDSAVATGLEKVSFHSNPKKGNAKDCSNYYTIALISHASKVMVKILQARLQQYVNCELPDVQAGFRKGRGTRDQLPTSTGS